MKIQSIFRRTSACFVIVLSSCQCSKNESHHRSSVASSEGDVLTNQAKPTSFPKTSVRLPTLAGKYCLPRSPGSSSFDGGYWKHPNIDSVNDERQFTSATQAEEFARKWIEKHFKYSTFAIQLEASHGTFPNPQVVTFTQTFQGYPVGDAFAWVEFKGTTPVRALVSVFELAEIRDSTAALVTQESVYGTWEAYAAKFNASLDEIVKREELELVTPYVMFYRSIKEAKNIISGREFSQIFYPTWVLDKQKRLFVAGKSGNAFFDVDR